MNRISLAAAATILVLVAACAPQQMDCNCPQAVEKVSLRYIEKDCNLEDCMVQVIKEKENLRVFDKLYINKSNS